MSILWIILGLILLILGGNWLLKSSVALSLKLDISKAIIGLTVVSFATSAPELIVSVNAALDGFSDLSLGNVVGSNIANLGLVLGVTLLFGSMAIEKSFYRTDWPVMMLSSALLFLFIYTNEEIVFYEGLIMFFLLVSFIFYLLKFQNKNLVFEEIPEDDKPTPFYKIIVYLFLGGLGLYFGSEFLIDGATDLATSYGVSEKVIAVTVVSVGTSIPELVASIMAVIRNEKAISLGNLIGSNIFNILAVLGITSMITPVKLIDRTLLTYDIYWMLSISFALLPFVYLHKVRKLNWVNGILLLVTYLAFIFLTLT